MVVINCASAVENGTCSTANSSVTVKTVDPVSNAVNVAQNKVIKITFNESIKAGNMWIELKSSNGTVIPITKIINSNLLTITPNNNLTKGNKYFLILHTGSITDLSGNNVSFYVTCFTVVDTKYQVKGYWMRYDDVTKASATDLKAKGITDVYVLTRGSNGVTHNAQLNAAIAKFKPYGIKVHAWIVCFRDGSDSHFVTPSGYYSYTKKAYVKTVKKWVKKKKTYRVWKKVKWKKIGKHWRYKWKKVTKYKWKKVRVYTRIYKNVTVKGYNTTYNSKLTSYIKYITYNYNVDGIHLDYVRYSGVASKNHAAWQEPGGEARAANAVTRFVKNVNSTIKSIKPKIKLSAAVMPECNSNVHLYGQNYTQLAIYLDYLVPMTYESSYSADNTWITNTIKYIVNCSNGKPVYAGLTTYGSSGSLTSDQLNVDVQSAKDGGALGYVLFRFGVGSTYVPSWTQIS
ncbi:Ig-like domain-containing protein [Methanobacterium oryzae]|uniref:Ig-like domain-containing protein n=1 Tax=Methanobacterium oryzae TaxID=69540 RepID=UPI003D244AA6